MAASSIAPLRASARPARLRARQTVRPRAVAAGSETAEERRRRETARVDERTKVVASREDFDAALALAEDNLAIVEIFSEEQCDLGEDPGAWERGATFNTAAEAKAQAFAPCRALASTFSRVARECEGVSFVLVDADASDESRALVEELGVKKLPTVQFWKSGDMLYQHEGAGKNAERDIAEGALYYGGQGANGLQSSEFVRDLEGKADFADWLDECMLPTMSPAGVELDVPCEQQLAVLDVSMSSGYPACMHTFPAVVALAKNTQGAVSWARILGDGNDECKEFVDALNLKAVPTFVFYAGKKEVGRYVGGDRVGLMQAVMEALRDNGYSMPTPPARKRMSIADARKIAEDKRKAQKQAGVRPSGW